MRTRSHQGILLLAAFFIFAAPAAGRAEDNLFRLYPELQMNGFYGDNIPPRTSNEIGDFGSTMVGGFYLDYTSAARYASLHYDTFVQLFTHQTKYDRAGEGQYLSATDDEYLSKTTTLRMHEFFYRDASALVAITTSDQSPQFNSVMALLLLANFQASINQFNADLTHEWGHNWSSELSVHQETDWATPSNGSDTTSYYSGATASTEYHFNDRFSLGGGDRFYDFRFSKPGQPGEDADWPFVKATLRPMENLTLEGMGGVVITHTQGNSGDHENWALTGALKYTFERGRLSITGGQEPSLATVFGGVGEYRGVSGTVLYDFTRRLRGSAGGSYYNFTGSGFRGEFVSWGVGLSERVNKWLSINTRFVQIRSNDSGSSVFLPSSSTNGQWAVGNYYIVGLAVSIEAFRWSWQ